VEEKRGSDKEEAKVGFPPSLLFFCVFSFLFALWRHVIANARILLFCPIVLTDDVSQSRERRRREIQPMDPMVAKAKRPQDRCDSNKDLLSRYPITEPEAEIQEQDRPKKYFQGQHHQCTLHGVIWWCESLGWILCPSRVRIT
jgi:hypothetical protein